MYFDQLSGAARTQKLVETVEDVDPCHPKRGAHPFNQTFCQAMAIRREALINSEAAPVGCQLIKPYN